MLVNCKVCGKKFDCSPSRIKEEGNCCSRECRATIQRSKDLNVSCDVCGKKFHLKPSAINKSKHHCCSKECDEKLRSIMYKGENNPNYGNKGKNSPLFKGEERIHSGYKHLYQPDHPFCIDGGWVREHRLIAEQHLLTEETSIEVEGKKYLHPKYVVHHIDGNKLNNDVSNLQIVSKGEHSRIHRLESPQNRNPKTGQFSNCK